MNREQRKLISQMGTPTRLGQTIGPEYMGSEYVVYEWLLEVERIILDALNDKKRRFIILNLPPQVGKLLSLDTPLATPDGWTTMGDVQVGDRLLGADGAPCTVTAVSEIQERPRHRVIFDDGTHIDAGPEHQWTTFDRLAAKNYNGKGPTKNNPGGIKRDDYADWWNWRSPRGFGPEVRRTEEIAQSLVAQDGTSNHLIPHAHPLDFPEADLPISPWVLGYWLGNGHRGSGTMTVGSHGGRFDLPDVETALSSAGWEFSAADANRGSNRVHVRGLIQALRALGIETSKKVPAHYLRSGAGQRLALLRGLMDSDGHAEGGGKSSFTSTDEHLADAVAELFVSLGAKVHRDKRPARLNGIEHGTSYRVASTPPFCPFWISRKVEAWKPASETGRAISRHHRFIVDVEVGEVAAMKCVEVDAPGHLYLAGRQMVPTHNSTFAMLCIAWYLGMNPMKQVIFVAYNEDYAGSWGLKVRNLLQQYGTRFFGETVSADTSSKVNWKMSNGFGGMISAGISGGITGNPGHLIWIDDVLKNMEEAASTSTKAKHLAEYDGSISSRFHNDTTVVITATRFAEDDLSGSLIERQNQPGYEGDRFEVISIPALAEPPEELELSEEELAKWTDLLGRHAGEPLKCVHEGDHFVSRRASLNAGFTWSAVYQQTPSVREGGMFPAGKWAYWSVNSPPVCTRYVRVWDLATTEGGGDYTVGSKFGLGQDGHIYLIERERGRWSTGQVEKKVCDVARRDGFNVKILIEQEKAGAGKAVVEHYQRMKELRGHTVESAKIEGSKEVRATPYSAMQQNEQIHLPVDRPDVVQEWIKEHKQMMGDGRRPRHDDQCLVGETLIETPGGLVRLDEVRPGDWVLGASGWTRAVTAGLTGIEPVVERFGLVGTSDHPVWTSEGWRALAAITSHDVLLTLCGLAQYPTATNLTRRRDYALSTTRASGGTATLESSTPPSEAPLQWTASPSMGSSSADTRTHPTPRTVVITSPTLGTSRRASRPSTKKFGNRSTGPSRVGTRSITSTATTPTTPLPTWAACPASSTRQSTPALGAPELEVRSNWPILSESARRLPNGTAARRVGPGIEKTPGSQASEVRPVYNLTTEDGTYFANGVLVHNCDTGAYAVLELLGQGSTDLWIPGEDLGTAQLEESAMRLIMGESIFSVN